eukprot:12599952-Alexandrium_andersonii.AAC.1
MGNPAFLDRRDAEPEKVGGFGLGMERLTNTGSDWTLTLRGSEICDGPAAPVQVVVTFQEFPGLGDPVILGLPTPDSESGFELVISQVWILSHWVAQLTAPRGDQPRQLAV